MNDAPSGRRRSVRPYLWVVGVFWVLPAVLTLLGYLFLPHHVASGQCEGIGFGCVPAPNFGLVIFMAYFGAPFLLVSGVLALGVVALVRYIRRDARPR
jgi:hypothetical protein